MEEEDDFVYVNTVLAVRYWNCQEIAKFKKHCRYEVSSYGKNENESHFCLPLSTKSRQLKKIKKNAQNYTQNAIVYKEKLKKI